jgi:two-component system, chemotaxis family, chemotaxis protein CheY
MAPLRKTSALIIDDNGHMRTILATILRSFGCQSIIECPDGAEALGILKSSFVDVILLDISMKPIDGVEFSTMLRRDKEHPARRTPIVMVSGHTERTRIMAARDAGVNEFVAKPVNAASLYERIRAALDHPRPWIETRGYVGPCRRRKADTRYSGPMRRASDAPPEKLEL